jgi:glyoxylase-like metal-dependent hydrolase (beta-lactamase superfamily II)/rhodanese-related sulfurtransferase
MYFKQFYLGCLAHASYLIGSNDEAAVVDPQRDVDIYIEEAKQQGFTIKHVIETHLHADFVSGHRELAKHTGARIYFGAKAGARFEYVPVREGDEIEMGKVALRFIETPGHTPESISVLIIDKEKSNEPEAVLTGDTLFIGDVGRPDLLGARMRPEELAGMLYDSLHEKLLKLPDSVKVYPAHGAGSLCGRNISNETSSTIGQQRRFNYALREMPREAFIKMMTTDLPEAPAYFSMDAQINREGPSLLDELPKLPTLSPGEVEEMRNRREKSKNHPYVILDTRPSAQYGTGHISGSLNIGLGGQFASWAGTLIKPDVPIIIVVEDEARVHEARVRLARVGLENVVGYLSGGILAWDKAELPLTKTEQISVDELNARIKEGDVLQVVDVRRPGEWESGHIRGAVHKPLNHLRENSTGLDKDKSTAVICAGGYRSSIATSLLEQQGFRYIINVVGGMSAWVATKLEVVTD